MRAAIAAGYGKGFHTIIDANVVTAITALVLFVVATAGVKGFALMLLIGTAHLDRHRGRRDAGDARPARRLQLVRQPALHGRRRPARSRGGSDRLRRAAQLWFAIAGVADRDLDRLADLQGPEPRHRLRGRHDRSRSRRRRPSARRRPRRGRASIGQGDAPIQGRGEQAATAATRSSRSARSRWTPAEQAQLTNVARARVRRDAIERPERLRQLRRADRRGRDPRDRLLASS